MKDFIKITIVAIVTSCISIFGFKYFSGEDVKFVSMPLVFEGCESKTEYQEMLKEFETKSNKSLELIKEELVSKQNEGGSQLEVQQLQFKLKNQQEQLSLEFQNRSKAYEDSVWIELNDKIQLFGEEKGYKFILGANGNGSIMYANEGDDVTKEVISFINR